MNLDFDEHEANKAVAAASDQPEHVVLSSASADDSEPIAPLKKRTWKKPKDKPKRPLSSYNLFFRKSFFLLCPADLLCKVGINATNFAMHWCTSIVLPPQSIHEQELWRAMTILGHLMRSEGVWNIS
jgi:hypothetical protein